MPESAEEYESRLASYLEGKDALAILSDTPRLVAEAIDRVAPERLVRRPAPDKWCVNEIVGHLLDDEIATAWRYRQMIEKEGALLAGFDQDVWARLGEYAQRDAHESLEIFRLLRNWNVRMLLSLTPEDWERRGVHAERGITSVRDLAHHMAGHDLNHVEQIRRILPVSPAAR